MRLDRRSFAAFLERFSQTLTRSVTRFSFGVSSSSSDVSATSSHVGSFGSGDGGAELGTKDGTGDAGSESNSESSGIRMGTGETNGLVLPPASLKSVAMLSLGTPGFRVFGVLYCWYHPPTEGLSELRATGSFLTGDIGGRAEEEGPPAETPTSG